MGNTFNVICLLVSNINARVNYSSDIEIKNTNEKRSKLL